MQKIKTLLPGIIYGIVLAVTALLGYQFYKGLSYVAKHEVQIEQINKWACTKDPKSCIDNTTGKPLQAEQPAAAPTTTTEEAPAPTR